MKFRKWPLSREGLVANERVRSKMRADGGSGGVATFFLAKQQPTLLDSNNLALRANPSYVRDHDATEFFTLIDDGIKRRVGARAGRKIGLISLTSLFSAEITPLLNSMQNGVNGVGEARAAMFMRLDVEAERRLPISAFMVSQTEYPEYSGVCAL
jgi:hypothetical protein